MSDREIAIFAAFLAFFAIYDGALTNALLKVSKAGAHVGALLWSILVSLIILLLMAILEGVEFLISHV